MITIHHLNNGRSHRIVWLLEELELPYEIVLYQRNPATLRAPAELQNVHPLGKSPVLTDGDIVVAESGAIIEYLLERYGNGRLQPTVGTAEWLSYRYWMHYAEGSLMPALVLKLVFRRVVQRVPFLIRFVAKAIAKGAENAVFDPQLLRHGKFCEARLGDAPWFAGNTFTAADIQMGFPVEVFLARSGMAEGMPHLVAFAEKIRARPAYQRAIARGGPLRLS